ncbi:MAG: HIT family protein, partial [Kiritimatiellae bacterium]|nr:HIT family protein [Kiritimatiellia bacterium]
MNETCLFCKIAAGEIPSVKVYEDDGVLAFLDISPVEKGHTLVISKRIHSEALLETPPEVLAEMLAAAKTVGAAMLQAGWGGFNLVQNNYPDGGQAVPHIHFHVIPRAKGRTAPLVWKSGANPYADEAERAAFAARIRDAIAQ